MTGLILLKAVYISPINSPVYENIDVKGIDIIENLLSNLNIDEYCILLAGDLNARVGVEGDCIDSISNLPMFKEYEHIFNVDPRVCERKSLDIHVNSCGRNLLIFLRILDTPHSRHIKKCYEMLKCFDGIGHTNWVTSLRSHLQYIGFGYVWEQQSVVNKPLFLYYYSQRLKDIFVQQWVEKCNSSPKL